MRPLKSNFVPGVPVAAFVAYCRAVIDDEVQAQLPTPVWAKGSAKVLYVESHTLQHRAQ